MPPEVDSEHRKERKMPETALERIIRDPTYKVDSPLAILIRQGMARKAESERPEEGKDSQEKSKESKEKSEDPREKGKQPMEEQPVSKWSRFSSSSTTILPLYPLGILIPSDASVEPAWGGISRVM